MRGPIVTHMSNYTHQNTSKTQYNERLFSKKFKSSEAVTAYIVPQMVF